MGRRCRRAGPEAWPAPERQVSRGGSWNNKPQNLRSANRNRNTTGNRNNNVGFRVASTARPPLFFSHCFQSIVERGGRESPVRARLVDGANPREPVCLLGPPVGEEGWMGRGGPLHRVTDGRPFTRATDGLSNGFPLPGDCCQIRKRP